MQMRRNQQGFGTVELILIVILVGLIGGVGYYVLQAKKTTNNIYTSTSNASTGNNVGIHKTASSLPKTTSTPTSSPTSPNPTTKPSPSPTPQSPSKSGITGHIYLTVGGGANCTSCHSSPSKPSPYQTSVTVKSSDGNNTLTSFTSDSNGYFSIDLNQGDYLLVPQAGNGYVVNNQNVTVKVNQYLSVDINYYGMAP